MTFCYSIQNRNNPFCCTLDFSFEFLLFGFRFGIFDGFELKIKASNEMEWANILRHCDFYHPPSSQAPYQSGCLCRIFFFLMTMPRASVCPLLCAQYQSTNQSKSMPFVMHQFPIDDISACTSKGMIWSEMTTHTHKHSQAKCHAGKYRRAYVMGYVWM